VLVVAAADSQVARDRLARDLAEWGFARTRTRKLFSAGETVGEAMVQSGEDLSLPLVAGQFPILAALPREGQPDVTLSLHYEGPLRAPVRKGEQVAELEIRVAGMEPSRVPLFAGNDVGKARGFDRLVNGLAGLFRW
jgi:D-alanyl-D-alanine carboxypeptidase (penicillin-binding protein 5/6)